MGVPGNQDTLGSLREHTYPVGNTLLKLIGKFVCLLSATLRIVEECNLGHEQSVLTRNRNTALVLGCRKDTRQSSAFSIDDLDGIGELFGGKLIASHALNFASKLSNFARPFLNVLGTLHLGHVHNVSLLVST